MKTSELETALMLMGFHRGVGKNKDSMFLFKGNIGYARVELKRNMPLGRYQAECWGIVKVAHIRTWTRKSLLQATGVLVEGMKEEISEYHQRIETVLENLTP